MAEGSKVKNAIWRAGVRIAHARFDVFLVARMRFLLFIVALLFLTVAFMLHDEWFVEEFADYDWARDLGF